MNLKKIEELNEFIAVHLGETFLALEGTKSEYKDMVLDKYLVTIEMLTEGVAAIRESVVQDLKGPQDALPEEDEEV